MRILLTTLNSKYIHSNLAVKYLYAAAQKNQRYIDMREFTINNDDEYIFTELVRGDYNVVCFSCYIWNIRRILTLGENLKKASPGVKIVLGGPEVSYDTVELMGANKWVDFVISGEGEGAFAQLAETLIAKDRELREGAQLSFDGDPYKGIVGLTYRKDGKLFVNPPSPPLKFSTVPFPYNYLAGESDKVLYYESSRGCPFRCSYCLSCLEKRMRSLPLDRVKTDLSYFIYKQVKQVKFIDRTFNWDPARCTEIMRYLMENDNGITNFHLELCGDLINPEFLSLMEHARPGLFQFEIGIQSTNERALAACNRARDTAKLFANLEKLRALGTAHLHLDLIAGLPGEDYFSFRKSFNDVYALRADQLQLGFLKLLKGTPLREEADKYGYVYQSQAPYEIISNHVLSPAGIASLKMISHVLDLYYNREGFSDSLKYAGKELAATPFDFYEEFASFFYLKGFQHRSHSKEDLYRIFYLYGQWKKRRDPDSADGLAERLAWDLERSMNPDARKKFAKKGWELS